MSSLINRPSARLEFLDVIRLAAMAFMVQGHTLDALVRPDQLDIFSFPWSLWSAMRGLTAPIFLLVSGTVGMLALKRQPDGRVPTHQLRRRLGWAFGLMALGYLLVFPANTLMDLRWLTPEAWSLFLKVNILHLNGAGLLVLTGLAWLTRSDRSYAGWAVVMGLVLVFGTPLSLRVDWFSHLPESLASYLTGSHGSLFPLFPHGAFLFLGAILGLWIKEDREHAPLRFIQACTVGTLGATVAAVLTLAVPVETPFWLHPGFTMIRLASALMMMGLVGKLALRFPRMTTRLTPLGQRSLHVYVGHLLLLFGLPWTMGLARGHFKAFSLGFGLAGVVVVFSITFGAVGLLAFIQARSARLHALLRLSAATYLAWALMF